MKKNNVENSFAKFAGKQLNSKQCAQIKGGNDGGSGSGGDTDTNVVVVDVIIT